MTYEQRITAEFEHEIAELYGKLYERDMEIERLRADKERLDWLQEVMTPAGRYCEVFFAGMRRGDRDAEAYQIESNPQQWVTLDRPTVREAIDAARAASRDEERDNG